MKLTGIPKKLFTLVERFRSFWSDDTQKKTVSELEPLLPVADLETYRKYEGGFQTIVDCDVTCVAVTGPYGAGKTSLIETFVGENSDLDFTRISLATFEGDDEQDISPNLIEKSILQQLIYSADPNKLEYSRFKKIRKPIWLKTKAFFLCLFGAMTGLAVKYWERVEEYLPAVEHWYEFVVAGIAMVVWLVLLVAIVHGMIKATAGLSIRKLSLKNAEIETEDKSKESVFNKHLDEIVYFFQETPCDILIIEDLDRFGKTEIFTKIREINQLINANPGVRPRKSKPIVFLFAIRDDLFKGKDRTKFFDLLIPVIPFVSAGNAYSVLHNKLENAGLRRDLKDKFLRQVSVYVTDNRHLVNTVNEYSLYRKNLFDENLDSNKLFGIILYKVFFPSDFGKLHMNDGVLAKLVVDLQSRRRDKRKKLSDDLKELNRVEGEIRQGHITSREALASVYVGAIQRKFQQPIRGFQATNGNETPIYSEDGEVILQTLQANQNLQVVSARGQRLGSVSVAELETAIHPGLSFGERLQKIDRIAELSENGINARKAVIAKEIRDVGYMPMKNAFTVDEIRERVSELEYGELLVYLVTEGYLSEDYDNYTAYFHKGAITRNDRDFVLKFYNGEEVGFDEKVDTPSEILLIVDDGLFGKPQGFNISILDHVIAENDPTQKARLVEGFQSFAGDAFRFLEVYYAEGKFVEKLLQILVKNWDGFIEAAALSENPLPHVREILGKVSEDTIRSLREPSDFIQFIAKSAPEVFDMGWLVDRIPFLEKSGVRISNINFPLLDQEMNATAISHIAENALWKISPNNVATILKWQGLKERAAQSEMFLSLENLPKNIFGHVEANLNEFVERCFLEVASTASEPQDGVEHLLSAEGLDEELGKRVIARQEARVKFLNVPNIYWDTIIEEENYVIDWQNFEQLLAEIGKFDRLQPIFRSNESVSQLALEQIKISEELFGFLADFDGMSVECYEQLISPELGEIVDFPSTIEPGKKLHLIQSGMIGLSDSAFDWLEGEVALRVALIEAKFETFNEKIEEWTLNDQELVGVLKSKIPLEAKRRVLLVAGEVDWGDDVSLLNEVLGILATPDTSIGDFDEDLVEKVIGAAPKSDGVKLLVRMISRWEEIRVMDNLKEIGSPYAAIANYGKMPTIAENEGNRALIAKLKEHGFISSFEIKKNKIRINTKRKKPSV